MISVPGLTLGAQIHHSHEQKQCHLLKLALASAACSHLHCRASLPPGQWQGKCCARSSAALAQSVSIMSDCTLSGEWASSAQDRLPVLPALVLWELIAKRLGQLLTVCIIISNHNFLKQRSKSLIKPPWTALVFTWDHSSGAGKQLQVVTFLNYRSFIWHWLQIWAVIPTTGNAFFTIGVTWDKGKTPEVWLLNVSEDFPSQNILKICWGLRRRHCHNVGNSWATFPALLPSHLYRHYQ